jgi:hypothetical protein
MAVKKEVAVRLGVIYEYMTSQATNRRKGGLTSCHSSSQKLRAFSEKELETMKAAQKLSARAGGCGGGR